MSIVRVGLSATKQFADGYDAIFARKKSAAKKLPAAKHARPKKTGAKKK